MRKKQERTESVVIEMLEGRRLMTAVLATSFDPIVGPIGTTPGTIGGSPFFVPASTTLESGTLVSSGFFLSFGDGSFVIGTNFGVGGTAGGHVDNRPGGVDNTTFFRKGFPILFSSGGNMRVNGATLNITGTNGNDKILFERAVDEEGRDAGLDVTMNGQTIRLDPEFSRFIRVVSVDAGRGDDLVSPVDPENFDIALNLRGGKGNDSLAGGTKNDTLLGQSGNDILVAGSGRDFLNGGSGNDTLAGGDSNDTLVGGNGNDQGDGDSSDRMAGLEDQAGLAKASKAARK